MVHPINILEHMFHKIAPGQSSFTSVVVYGQKNEDHLLGVVLVLIQDFVGNDGLPANFYLEPTGVGRIGIARGLGLHDFGLR